jgi:uncharacterized membrane protein (UPF0182 family)
VQNSFNSDTDVANELNILQRGDTKVTRGNLLTLPVGGGLLYVQPVYVQSTGETSYPLLRKILVAFGDKVAFEDTLDGALNVLFDGDSGADAGDEGTDPTDPGTSPSPDPTPTPTDPSDPTSTPTPQPTGEPGTGGEISAELKDALSDAAAALQAREAAYAKNDLVAAAQADTLLQEALERAVAASE